MTPELRKHFGWATTLVLLGLVVALFAFAFSYAISGWKSAVDPKEPRRIVVAGEGRVSMKPDVAVFTVAVVTITPKAKDAQAENANKSNAILQFLKGQGIPDKDLRTVGYSLTPQYQYDQTPVCYRSLCPPQKPPKIVSFEVRNSIEVKARDFDKVDDLLAGVVEKGGNEVVGISFTVEDPEKARTEARKKAIDNAKVKADILARDLGVRLGRIVGFSESGNGVAPRYVEYDKVAASSGASAGPEVAPGEQEISSSVSISYEFR